MPSFQSTKSDLSRSMQEVPYLQNPNLPVMNRRPQRKSQQSQFMAVNGTNQSSIEESEYAEQPSQQCPPLGSQNAHKAHQHNTRSFTRQQQRFIDDEVKRHHWISAMMRENYQTTMKQYIELAREDNLQKDLLRNSRSSLGGSRQPSRQQVVVTGGKG